MISFKKSEIRQPFREQRELVITIFLGFQNSQLVLMLSLTK